MDEPDKVGHPAVVVPVPPAGDEELIAEDVGAPAAAVEADTSSLASWLAIRSRDDAASRDGGDEMSGGMAWYGCLEFF